MPRKQRHTAKRVFDRLREESGFTGGYTIIKDDIRERERRGQEVFVPLSHPSGHAQADFGEALVRIGGVAQKAHFFVLDLPHSDACYVRAYPAAVTEARVDGHIHAFAFFGAVPQSVLYDNDRCLVAKILPDGTRKRASLFSGFLSHYLIRDRYGRPGKGNDKGNVEGLVGYSRRNFMVPMPEFATWEAFNLWLEDQCRKRQRAVLRGESETIGERLQRDLAAMRPYPDSIRLGQAGRSSHFRPSRRRALASKMSLRMTAVIASFGGFPLSSKAWYLRLRSALNRTAINAGMKIADRRAARPPRIISLPFHFPDLRVKGASPARLAACLGSGVPSSGISISSMCAVTRPTPGMLVRISRRADKSGSAAMRVAISSSSSASCLSIKASRAFDGRLRTLFRAAEARRVSGVLCMNDPVHASSKGSMPATLQGPSG